MRHTGSYEMDERVEGIYPSTNIVKDEVNIPRSRWGNAEKFRNIIISVLNVAFNVAVTVTLPIFVGTLEEVGGDAYTLLISNSITLVIILSIITVIVKYTGLNPEATLKPAASWKVLVAMGIFNTFNGILIVYASPPDRTPPYLQGILSATVIPYTVVFRFIILRKGISKIRGFCTFLVLIGVFITTVPQIWGLDSSGGEGTNTSSTAARILWPMCFALGFLPVGLSNVFCEKELKKDEVGSLGFLVWTFISQLIFLFFFFWTDFIPYFGTSSSPSDFFEKFQRGMQCIYSTDASCRNLIGKAWLFYSGFPFAFLFQFMLIQYAEGAIYAVIVQAMISPIAALFWTFFKFDVVKDIFKWDPEFTTTTGCTIGGLCVIVPAVILYNYFGRREAERSSNVQDISISAN